MKVAQIIYMYILGAIVIILSFLMGYLLATNGIPEGNKDVVMVLIGVILGWGSAVISYFFGSSKSSADKNEILSKKNETV